MVDVNALSFRHIYNVLSELLLCSTQKKIDTFASAFEFDKGYQNMS